MISWFPKELLSNSTLCRYATVSSFAELYDSRMIAFGCLAGAVILVPTFLGGAAGKRLKEMGAEDDGEEEEEDGGKPGKKSV